MKITNKVLFFRAFSLVFGLLFIGCGEYNPDIGAWIDGHLEKAREATEEVPAGTEPTSPEPTSPESTADAVAEVNKAADSEIKSALETYAKELELDLTLYGMLSDGIKNATAQSMNASKPYLDKEAIQTAFTTKLHAAAIAATEKNLSLKFKITPEGSSDKAFVEASFNAVHNYIQKAFAVNTTEAQSVIKLGDYIDLKYLNVAGDGGSTNVNDGYINATSGLRLIVIGINSFNVINGNNTPHVVFHFENIPGKHKMNNTDNNTTGYLGSAMREYIVNNFLTGLENAGVPKDVLWRPIRRVASRGDGVPTAQTVKDDLWLPTEREMFGFGTTYTYGPWSVTTVEKAENQANFTEFYTNDEARTKSYASNSDWYWLASPDSGSASTFCYVIHYGYANYIYASSVGGCAPAFCVQ
ncbi:MAG: hypothetical protein Ta2F_11540 [Termitinemataceae bacterium]|nr:MAG: hypothetical protein Ta2F_11540 [Termitinemataceae bacterium]